VRSILPRTRPLVEVALRLRYLVLVLVAALVAGETWHSRKPGVSDWLYVEYGARTIAHMGGAYSSGLHLYARQPEVQIGPPPLAVVAAFQWLPPAAVAAIFVAIMALCGVLVVWCAERIARQFTGADPRRIAQGTLVAGVVVVALWSREAAAWQHLDDVMAITASALALMLIVRQQHWWLASVLIGLGVASKPWAIILTPMLLGLPRVRRAPAALITVAVAGACWAPFILADRGTISALGQLRLFVSPTSTLTAFGVHAATIAPDWVRPLQLAGGFLLMWWLARTGRWTAVLYLGLLFRVVTDPQAMAYYGVGPLVGALIWELSRGRRAPVLTIAVAVVEFALPVAVPSAMPWLRLILIAACAFAVCRAAPDTVRDLHLSDDQRVPGRNPTGLHDAADHAQALVV
jgi:hypothetical protein